MGWLALLVLQMICAGALAQDGVHLRTSGEIDEVCAYASVVPAAAEKGKVGEYLQERQKKVQALYLVEVSPSHFELSEYDPHTQLLALVAQRRYLLAEGGHAVELPEAPLLAFEASESLVQELKMECRADNTALRLTFLLEGVDASSRPYCEKRADGVTTLRGQLVKAQLWRRPGKGSPRGAELAVVEVPEVMGAAHALGVRGDGRHRVPLAEVRKARVVTGEVGPEEIKRVEKEAALLVAPCFWEAIRRGGPESAALVVEVGLDEKKNARQPHVVVDATGYPWLASCGAEALQHLEGGALKGGTTLKLPIFFERR